MTTLQKTLVGAILVAAIGTGIYEARKASILRNQVSVLEQQQTALTELLTSDRDEATRQLAAARPGDSGGPLVLSDGRLLSINIGWRVGFRWSHLSFERVHNEAYRPDLAWLRKVIETDAALQAMSWPNQGAAANRRPAGPPDGSDNLSATLAADRAFPAAVAELGLGIMAIHTFKTAIILPAIFIFTSCARFPSPRVELHGTNSITIHYSDNYGLPRYAQHPIIEASINGITGPFVMDTGATLPLLTMTGARRCGISSSLTPALKADTWGLQIDMKRATNVSLELAPGFVVRWPKVLVHPGEDVTFGTLDYGTLKAGHAVIDIKQKTITMTK